MTNRPSIFGRWQIHHFAEIDSTSTWLKSRRAELDDYTIAVTDFQSAGRGRLGRKWVAPPSTALMFSMLLRPNWPLDRSAWLMMVAGIAAANALSDISGAKIQLKWPNDLVFIDDAGLQKVGGILSEAETADGKLTEAIIGIGLNINMTQEQLPQQTHTPAASLHTITKQKFDREATLERILINFQKLYDDACKGTSPHRVWRNLLITLGEPVTATQVRSVDDPQKFEGVATGVDEWGRLEITLSDGTVKAIAAGDVTLRS